LLGAGFAVFNLPWVVYYGQQLGPRAFLRAILFVGTGFDKFYYIAYPPASPWALLLIVACASLVLIGALMRARVLPRALVITTASAGFVAAVVYLHGHPPPMVEGLQRAVVSRVRDIAFLLVLAVEWSGLIAALLVWQRFRRPLRRDLHDADSPLRVRQAGTLVITLLGAALMHMQLYPRTDYMHLVPASPAILVLGAWLLDRTAKTWALGLARRLRTARLVRLGATLPVYALILALLVPALRRIDYLVRAWLGRDASALVYLDPQRAPLVIEPAASRLFDSLRLTAQHVRNHTRPEQAVFGFPVLDLLCFLSERHNPTRHGYFFPGWPGHAVEAEVIDSLRHEPPAYVVTLHDHTLFFATAPIYYFDLRQFVLQNYRLERRIGIFDVFQRAATTFDTVAAPLDTELIAVWRAELRYRSGATARRLGKGLAAVPMASPQTLAAMLQNLDGKAQRQLISLIRKSRSDDGAAALALGLENGSFASAVRELAVRVIAEVGNVEVIPPLLRALTQTDSDRGTFAGLLYTVAAKLALENYWYGIPADRELGRIAAYVPPERLIGWMEDTSEGIALRSFAVRLAAVLGYQEVVPVLARMVGDVDDWGEMRIQAADALAALGKAQIVLPAIVNLLRVDTLTVPGLVAASYGERPEQARAALLGCLSDADPRVRASAFWVAAAVRDAELESVLDGGLRDPLPEIRLAAVWGLSELGTPAALQALRGALSDSNDEVAQFAQHLLRRAGTT
jgi:HEAT repeat protein